MVSHDTSEATVPATVTIAANQSAVSFTVTAVDDTLLDGERVVAVEANAAGYVGASDVVTVTDVETLAVSIAADSIIESGGSATATVTRSNTDNSEPLTVSCLVSHDTSEATVPATVTIAASESAVSFTVTAVDDTMLDGPQLATVTANANGYIAGTDDVVVTDHETLAFSIDANLISESGGSATATVTRNNTDNSQPLTVSLVSHDMSEATVPATVTIAANQSAVSFTVTAVDDALLDGERVVTVEANAAGYVGASDVVTVTDFETLAISIDADSISESGGSATATVTRNNTDNSQPLTVSLASHDTSEATVPATVTIAANQSAVSFTVTAVDDTLLDGERVVTVEANAAGYVGASDVVTVTDAETLAVSIAADSIIESGGSATATVTRSNTDNSEPLTVSLVSHDTSEATVPATVTIAASESAVSFTVTAVDDTMLDGPQLATVTANANGYIAGTDDVVVTDHETLAFSIDANLISESGGSATATVTRNNTDNSQPLTVSLVSHDTSEATVPATVTIAANQSAVSFTVTAVDDTLLDGERVVAVEANAAGYVGASDVVTVTDVETLAVSIAADSIIESGGSATATVTRSNTDNSEPLTVSLVSHDTSEATVPATVTIAASESAVSFTVTAVDNTLLDGERVAVVTASANGYIPGTDDVVVTDHETLAISIDADSVSESGGSATATVTRSNTDNSEPLTVSLASHDTSEATVPATVTIAANQSAVSFTVTAVDDTMLDGPQLATVTANANGYIAGTDDVVVTDHETLAISIDADSISESGGSAIATVTRSNTDNSEPLTVSLASHDTSEATVPATVTIAANQSAVSFTVTAVDNTLLDGERVVTVEASAEGYVGVSDVVTVTDHETLTVSLEVDSIVETMVATARVTRSNTDNSQPLTVSLTSNDTSEATVPQSVTIASGEQLTSFLVTTIDDSVTDGQQLVQIVASAIGYASLSAEFEVVDDPFPWQNDSNKNDVNADGISTTLDALLVINYLHRYGSHELPLSDAERTPPPYYDTNGDGYVTTLDALVVINNLNRHAVGEGEEDSFVMEQPDWFVRLKSKRTFMDSHQAVFAENFDYLETLTNKVQKSSVRILLSPSFLDPRNVLRPD